jgi:hypothetical protein
MLLIKEKADKLSAFKCMNKLHNKKTLNKKSEDKKNNTNTNLYRFVAKKNRVVIYDDQSFMYPEAPS